MEKKITGFDLDEWKDKVGELSLADTESLVFNVVVYGDYLAEQKKNVKLQAKDLKRHYRHIHFQALKKSDLGDAKARSAEADEMAAVELDRFETAEIEADYIQDLIKNNHDKNEALRSILSSKKTVFEKTYNNTPR